MARQPLRTAAVRRVLGAGPHVWGLPAAGIEDVKMARPYDEIADQVQSGEEDAVARLREVVTARRDERGEHARWGRLCE